MNRQTDDTEQRDVRRQRSQAVRTAWLLAAFAVLVFVAFILSGVLGRGAGP